MRISTRCEYAIHSLLYLKLREPQDIVELSEMARAQGLSPSFLAKIFADLTRAGFTRSFRGAKGGYCLLAGRITLKDILLAVEREAPPFRDSLAQRGCDWISSCRIKDAFERAYVRMLEELDSVTLEDLAVQFGGGGFPSRTVESQA